MNEFIIEGLEFYEQKSIEKIGKIPEKPKVFKTSGIFHGLVNGVGLLSCSRA